MMNCVMITVTMDMIPERMIDSKSHTFLLPSTGIIDNYPPTFIVIYKSNILWC